MTGWLMSRRLYPPFCTSHHKPYKKTIFAHHVILSIMQSREVWMHWIFTPTPEVMPFFFSHKNQHDAFLQLSRVFRVDFCVWKNGHYFWRMVYKMLVRYILSTGFMTLGLSSLLSFMGCISWSISFFYRENILLRRHLEIGNMNHMIIPVPYKRTF